MALNETVIVIVDRTLQSTVANYSINFWVGVFALIGVLTVLWKVASMVPQLIMTIAHIHGGIKWLYNLVKRRKI